MSGDSITREDLRDMRHSIERGIDNIVERLDMQNGRIGKAEALLARHDERFDVMVKPVVEKAAPLVAGDWKVLTGAGVILAGAVSGLLQGLWAILELISKKAGQ